MEDIKELAEKTKNLKVLFVDDEKDIRDSVNIFFNKFVNTFYIAKNGEEGLSIFKEQDIDVVITDILMPQMNGFEMLEEIRKINPHIFVIIVSASDEDKINAHTKYNLKVKKPILFEDIIQIIKAMSQI